eukprot:1039353-Prorocentrum_minimum.AAC.1
MRGTNVQNGIRRGSAGGPQGVRRGSAGGLSYLHGLWIPRSAWGVWNLEPNLPLVPGPPPGGTGAEGAKPATGGETEHLLVCQRAPLVVARPLGGRGGVDEHEIAPPAFAVLKGGD